MTASIERPAKGQPPRYIQLAAELRAEILSGKFVPSDHFPTENALCQRYAVSRFTVREALRRLQQEGLIARRRGSGTVVQPAAARGGALHQPLSNVAEILQYARDTRVRYEPAGRGRLPAKIAEQIAEDTAGDWLVFDGVRSRDGDAHPIATITAFVHGRHEESIQQMDLADGTLFRQLEELEGVRVARVTQDIQAVGASAAVAASLGIARRAATLRILRCYFDRSDRLFEISVSHHPGDRFAYAMHIDVDR